MSSEATFLQGGWALLTRIEGVRHLHLRPSSSISMSSSYTPESAKDGHAFNDGYGRAVPNSKQSTKVTAEERGGPQGEGGKDLAVLHGAILYTDSCLAFVTKRARKVPLIATALLHSTNNCLRTQATSQGPRWTAHPSLQSGCRISCT